MTPPRSRKVEVVYPGFVEGFPIFGDGFFPYLEPQTTLCKWLFQLDDSKSLYCIENGLMVVCGSR